MKFHSAVIFVENIERSKQFYINLLDQKIEHDFGKNVIFNGGLTLWEVQQNHIIEKQLDTKSKSNRFEMYFEAEFIEEIYDKLKAEFVEFLHEIAEEPWGQRTIRFFDPDKHLIEIGEPLEIFVMNMKNKGLSSQQISEKSGIPLPAVNKIIEDSE